MTYVWIVVGLFAGSVIAARWQFSRARMFCMFLWYRHWRMRERQRAVGAEMYRRYPRFMHWKHRTLMPYYRVRNSELVWAIRERLSGWWYRYACLFVPTCPEHNWPIQGGICYSCMLRNSLKKSGIELPSSNK